MTLSVSSGGNRSYGNDQTLVSVLSIWSWPETISAKTFFPFMLDLAREIDMKPSQGFYSIPSLSNLKYYSFMNFSSKLELVLDHINWLKIENIKNIERPRFRRREYSKHFVDTECRKSDQHMNVAFEDHLELYNPLYLSDIVRRVSALVTPCYAFATRIPQSHNVGLFLAGVGEGERGERFRPQLERMKREWGADVTARTHCTHRIRDLYTHNFLNRSHLDSPVRSGRRESTWAEFIARSGFGSLTPVTGHLWRWSLTDDEIAACRPTLLSSGKLVMSE